MKLPNEIDIFTTKYKVIYCDKAGDVNPQGRSAQWGDIDVWTNEIRIFKRPTDIDTFKTLMHEIIHGVVSELRIPNLHNKDYGEVIIEQLAIGLTDVLIRNKIIEFKGES